MVHLEKKTFQWYERYTTCSQQLEKTTHVLLYGSLARLCIGLDHGSIRVYVAMHHVSEALLRGSTIVWA